LELEIRGVKREGGEESLWKKAGAADSILKRTRSAALWSNGRGKSFKRANRLEGVCLENYPTQVGARGLGETRGELA